MRCDLEVDEKVGVDDGGKKEDGSKRTSHDRCESGYCVNWNIEKKKWYEISPHDDYQPFVDKLIHVHIRNDICVVQIGGEAR